MSYQNLQVYHRAHAMGLACHQLSLRLPKFKLYESGSQLRRASKSVSSNIVEGYGRKQYPADYLRFLVIALASNDETREWLVYISECHPDYSAAAITLITENEEIGRMLNALIRSL
ncbi:MAG TPA: four helix bundle protein [Roseimicrobium sp.]|nr:four helix bundle protein [Roseimicrobium sp.]